MRLLHTKTYELTEFQGSIPEYAILSHVWEKDWEEVIFKDIGDLDRAKKMQGFAKIAGACRIARKHGFCYIWIDTCCINKESSAELSEAINSMYMWYAKARICYAYLPDVSGKGDREYPCALFMMSRWFSRGWTLQELIAPSKVVFYEANWVNIGTKSSLQESISEVTGISREAILGSVVLDDVPIAVRMFWAAERNTTREEDIAYSLMGLFGINMPLLYGEGRKAFIRLQHEIIKKSDDHSIFAWTAPGGGHRGMLARSPSEFRGSGEIERILSPPPGSEQPRNHANNSPPFSTPYSITNQGLHIALPIKESEDAEASKIVFLNCRFAGTHEPIVITLVQHRSLQPNKYVRSNSQSLEWKALWYERKVPTETFPLFIADDYAADNSSIKDWAGRGFRMRVKVPAEYGKPVIRPIHFERGKDKGEDEGEYEYDFEDGDGDEDEDEDGDYEIWAYKNGISTAPFGVLVFEEPDRKEKFAVLVGFRGDRVMWCDVLTETNSEDKDGWERLDRCGHWRDSWIPQRTFRDFASADLNDGWSIVVSPRAGATAVDVEIKKSPKLMSLLKRPEWKVACLVVPPAPKHGFTVAIDGNGFQQAPSTTIWVQHLDTFVLYTNERSMGAGALTFRRNESDEEFTLFVRTCQPGQSTYRWDKILFEVQEGRDDLKNFLETPVKRDGLVQKWPERSDCQFWDGKGLKGVVATIMPCRDLADYRIDISYCI